MVKLSRRDQKERTRARIIKAAMGRLAVAGLTKVSTADIAKSAQVSHGTIFVHFPTREALLTAVIEEFGARVAGRLHELAQNGSGLREILIAHLQGLIEFEPFYTRLVIEGRLLPDRARQTLVVIQSAISLHISQAAEAEMEEGLIRKTPIHLLFNTWMGLVHYYLANGDLFSPRGSVLLQHGPALIDHYLNLISAPNR
ncbi:MAG: TetR/AcrR family transcriptional regulator [Firmicutes bacterium]|nr:TetR/AcrR family transcriptional regulator [Bacillota bacterium]